MKILMISTLNLSQPNGGTAHFLSLAQEFRRQGHTIHALIPDPGAIWAERAPMDQHFDQVFFSSRHLSRLIPLSKTSINTLAQIPTILSVSRQNYDWVYLRSNLFSSLISLALRMKGFPNILAEQNGWFADELNLMGVPGLFHRLVEQFQVMDARLASLVAVVVPGIQKKLMLRGVDPAKILVTRNATDIELFQPLERKQALQQVGLDPDFFYLGFIGDLEPWQGVETAIQAMPLIASQYPQVRLLVVGQGRQYDYLVQTYGADARVQFLGSVPYAQSNLYINCFDLALLPKQGLSEIGYSPIKFYAYAAAGRAILASRIAGIQEFEPAGFLALHHPGDVADLAAQAIALIGDPDRLAQMQAISRRYAEQYFSWQLVSQEILAVMESG
ncbi:glycosyltransferase family 4 protein [Leptolyngbya sp. 'hensonii']|uniref:glycosyltransferase family 4 protein n=1 Tax=Leptolyngbya sp. 'hensonii' TaxID=1922337 RepID=UPI0015598523|nr:glycosyltransferase family 4 protein [Leptolyngbya sp. 'hensonii']